MNSSANTIALSRPLPWRSPPATKDNGMQFSAHKRRRPPAVIIVSLIDVLLVVLIFLMVTSTFKKDPPPELRLALPESKQAKPGSTESKPLIISVATNAPYFFMDDKPLTFERVQKELAQAV